MINLLITPRTFFFLFLTILLSSCFEIIEEVDLNNDGSGKLSYTLNLSQSRTKLNSVMILDSLNGLKIPDEGDIRAQINEVLELIQKTDGITAVNQQLNFDDYIFNFSCNFSNPSALNEVTQLVKSTYKIKDPYTNSDDHFTYNSVAKTFRRKGDYAGEADLTKVKEEDLSLLKDAMFTGIYRFESEIKSSSNPKARVSPSRKAAMVKFNVMELVTKKQNIENTILLK